MATNQPQILPRRKSSGALGLLVRALDFGADLRSEFWSWAVLLLMLPFGLPFRTVRAIVYVLSLQGVLTVVGVVSILGHVLPYSTKA